MKIEICEQMVQSWLINCELCEIVQTNWTISPLREITDTEITNIADLMEDIQSELNKQLNTDYKTALHYNISNELKELYDIGTDSEAGDFTLPQLKKIKELNIFKKSNAAQFIRQCEIDVVGVKFDNSITKRIYLVDSAFHKNGLGYHDVVATVLKKIIRAILVSAIIFGTKIPVSVIFAAPKCGVPLYNTIKLFVYYLKNLPIIKNNYSNISIELYFNEIFTNKIYSPLKEKIDKLNDDNDLFMRSLNLAKVSESYSTKATSKTPSAKKVTPQASATNSATGQHQGKNQKIIFDALEDIKSKGKLDSKLLAVLESPDETKKLFKTSTYPLLQKKSACPSQEYMDEGFYKTKFFDIGGVEYLVCKQLNPKSVHLFQNWYSKF